MAGQPDNKGEPFVGRPWIGMMFDCCNVYVRIYRTADGSFYRGLCPGCGRSVRLRVGGDGTSSRMFRAR